jgi:ABC-type transporter Mla subunit MlaD
MNLSEIIKELTQERSKLDAAILALEGVSNNGASAPAKRRGRPPGSTNQSAATSAPRKRRTMSAAARKLISEAQKARWAKQKRAAK